VLGLRTTRRTILRVIYILISIAQQKTYVGISSSFGSRKQQPPLNFLRLHWEIDSFCFRDEPWPHPTQAYFWPAVNKKPARLWPGYLLTRPEEIFLTRREKLKILTFLEEIFPMQTQTIKGWPNLTQHKPQKLTWFDPGKKFLTRTHHYSVCRNWLF